MKQLNNTIDKENRIQQDQKAKEFQIKKKVMKKTYIKQRAFQSFLYNEEDNFLDNEKVITSQLPSKIEFMIRNLYQRGDS